MRILFMPVDGTPYQSALDSGLHKVDVEVVGRPLSWFLLGDAYEMDVIHIHWTSIFAGTRLWKFSIGYPLLAFQLCFLRMLGRKIVWTVHNLQNHEERNARRDRLISILVGKAANKVIVHGKSAVPLVSEKFLVSTGKIVCIPHGNYIGVYPDRTDRALGAKSIATME